MTGKSPDKSDDAALFRAAVGAVKPLAKQNRIHLQKTPRKAFFSNTTAPVQIADNLSDFVSADIPSEYLGNGLARLTLRKLRNNTWPIQARLDLHGYNSDAARQQLQAFLFAAKQRALRCVLVIHGKGMNSKDGAAVLKNHTRHWLMQHPLVLAYCDAAPRDGGTGAAVILLKSKP